MGRTKQRYNRSPLIVTLILTLATGLLTLVAPPAAAAPLWSWVPNPFPCSATSNSCVSGTGFDPNASHWYQDTNSKGNCTNYVAYRLKLNGAPQQRPWGSGNAWTWADRASGVGYPVNDTPAVGSVAWWGTNGGRGSDGHVAYVEQVSGDTIWISESIWNKGSGRQILTKGKAGWPQKFIHIKDAPNDNPFGGYDSASSPGQGRVQVSGWAADPNSPTTSIDVHVYIGGEYGTPGVTGAHSIKANKSRPDVAAALPGFGEWHGFSATFDVVPGSYPVCVYGINIGAGSNQLLGCKNVTVSANPFGSYETAVSPEPGKVRVKGWTMDPDARTSSTDVHIYVGGQYNTPGVTSSLSIKADKSRPDVGAAFPGAGDRHGFDVTFNAAVGTYPVCVYAINIGVGSHQLIGCKNVTVAGCTSAPFKDVPKSSPFCGHIKWMKEQAISTGWPDGTYRPGADVNRDAMAAFMARSTGASLPACTKAPFKDVPKSHPFCPQIKWMSDKGISTGWADGTFRPNDKVSRDAIAAFMARLAGASLPACTSAPFKDVPKSHPFCAQIKWMSDKGISTGWPDGTFRPGAKVTREAMSAFLYRLDKLLG